MLLRKSYNLDKLIHTMFFGGASAAIATLEFANRITRMCWNPLCIAGMFSMRTSVEKRALETSRTSKFGQLSCEEKTLFKHLETLALCKQLTVHYSHICCHLLDIL